MPSTYTASSVFLKALADAGITHAFVNWGSDHPALLEDLERQRIENEGATALDPSDPTSARRTEGGGGDGGGTTKPEIVTCPNEMVALSAAQGFAQVAGKPAAVIVHVDVGTQAMAGAIHNVDRGRTPVLIYAGASPFSAENEHKGSRNEWIMWLQDTPDQSAIVRQYMRYTAQFGSGATIPQTVGRALQIATSDPKGPVYLWARREVMEAEVAESAMSLPSRVKAWPPVDPTGLSPSTANVIAEAILNAKNPLIITSFIGRNPDAVPVLARFAQELAIPVFQTCPSAMNIPASHPCYAGVSYLFPGTHYEDLGISDVILILDCDLPWIPANDRPPNARVFVIDSGDPLKRNMGLWLVDAEIVCNADSRTALDQLLQSVNQIEAQEELRGDTFPARSNAALRKETLINKSHERLARLQEAEQTYQLGPTPGTGSFTTANIMGVLRASIMRGTPDSGNNTLILNEAISNFPAVWAHLRPEVPGSIFTSGGSSLGWSLGAAVGVHLACTAISKECNLIVAIVGDGSFLFGVPSSSFWMARKYNTPFLTIVLNNGGWKSPKLSMMGIYPDGLGSKASGERLSVGFGPECPDFSQIAVAATAGWAWGKRVIGGEKHLLESVIMEAIRVVVDERRCAILDCVLESV